MNRVWIALVFSLSLFICGCNQDRQARKSGDSTQVNSGHQASGIREPNQAAEEDEPTEVETKYRVHPTKDPNQSDGIYIPKDMNDCFVELERMLSPKFIKEFKKKKQESLVEYHFGLGMWMRNNWGLWKGSRLRDYLAQLGFRHTDDMSGAIITCFWRHLNGLPIQLEEQAEASRRYWQVFDEPADRSCPEHHVPIKLEFKLLGSTELSCVHVGRCPAATGELWVYELRKGWYKPEGRLRERIEELEKQYPNGGLDYDYIEKL